MIVSEARKAANRRNALKSTGPKTPEGKERSRANALKHGLCASAIVPEDAQLVQERAVDFYNTLKPQNHFHCWLVSEISLTTIRIERCERSERRVRDKIAIRAELSWDEDRRLEAVLLGSQLGINPEVVVEQLRKTVHGCEWMMARWAMLAYCADVKKEWIPAQEQLAFDLLGTPAVFREGHKPGASLDFRGRVVESADDPASVARREIAALEERRDLLSGLDEASRVLAASDLGDDTDPELKRLRRYESTLHGKLRWCMAQLRHESPHTEPLRGLMRNWLGQFEPTPEPAPAPPPIPEPKADPTPPAPTSWINKFAPPFDLEDDEVPPLGEELDLTKILDGRRRKEAERARDRREDQRQKVRDLLG